MVPPTRLTAITTNDTVLPFHPPGPLLEKASDRKQGGSRRPVPHIPPNSYLIANATVSALEEAEQPEGIMNTRRFNQASELKASELKSSELKRVVTSQASVADRSALREEDFLRVIWHEQKRAERTHKPCLLMLVEMEEEFPLERNRGALGTILSALSTATRETDVTGWYQDNCVVGVLFTEIMFEDGASIVTKVMTRVSEALRSRLSSRHFNQACVSFHLFPGERGAQIPALVENPALYPDLVMGEEAGRLAQR